MARYLLQPSSLILIDAIAHRMDLSPKAVEYHMTKALRALKEKLQKIKSFFISLVAPLNGGRWVHETEDFLHPKLEFWMEDDELKYARLNGVNY